MSIKKNQMHEMLDEMGRFLEPKIKGKIFKVDTIPSGTSEVAKVYAGSIWETRKKSLEAMAGLYTNRRDLSDKKFDVLLYSVPNFSPYAINSFMNPILTLISSGLGYLGGAVQAVGKPGCSVILVTPCPNQWDTVFHASYPEVWKTCSPRRSIPTKSKKVCREIRDTRGVY